MKTLLAVVFAMLIAQQSAAQNWCPPGAAWTYEWYAFTQTGYADVIYTGDTIVNGLSSQKLVAEKHVYDFLSQSFLDQPLGTYLTTVNGELVSILTQTGFDTLYWFGAGPGDQWSVSRAFDPVQLIVGDTGTVVIQGVPLHFLAVTYQPPYGIQSDTVFERIGSRQVFIDASYTLQIDGPAVGSRCYADQDISFTTGIAPDCNFILGVAETPPPHRIALYPNPISGDGRTTVRIALPFDHQPRGALRSSLVASDGRLIEDRSISDANTELQLSLPLLCPGLYFVRLASANTWLGAAELVVE
ncbi:MAG: hypothetical protein ABI599_03615 [Flavobacteriales bacterium]